jgi:hypothetical protein
MTHVPSSSRIADPDALRASLAAQREHAEQLARETAALRREAAELLRQSRWWRDERRRELLRHRRWHGAAPAPRDAGARRVPPGPA